MALAGSRSHGGSSRAPRLTTWDRNLGREPQAILEKLPDAAPTAWLCGWQQELTGQQRCFQQGGCEAGSGPRGQSLVSGRF